MSYGGPESETVGWRFRTPEAQALAAVVVAAIAAGCLVFLTLALRERALEWDEAKHALYGALVAHDLGQGDLLGFALDSYLQVYWPPFHSWLSAAVFLAGGASMEAARGISVAAYVLLAPTLFLVARTIEPRHGVVAGCLAAGLALTAPELIELAAMNWLELPGLLAMSCTLLIYCALERDPDARPGLHLLLGASVVVAYLIKTHYGILLGIAIVFARLIEVRFDVRRLLTKRNLYAALPLVLFCVVWFAYLPKIEWTWAALVNQPYAPEEPPGIAGLTRPRALAEVAGSWRMSALLWIGVLVAWRTGGPGVSMLAILAVTVFVIGELHHTKADRHILPMLPPMFALTGVAGSRLWAWLRVRGRGGRVAAVAALGLVAWLHASALASRDWGIRRGVHFEDALHYVSVQAREGAPTLLLLSRSARPSPPIVDWTLVSEGLLPVTAAGAAIDPTLQRRLGGEVRDAPLPESLRASLLRRLDRYDAPARVRSLQAGDEDSPSRAGFEATVSTTLRKDPPRTIIAMLGTTDTTRYGERYVLSEVIRAGFRRVSTREFPRVVIHVYRRP